MRIVCLLKQVPRPDRIEFMEETKSLRREGIPLVTNPFDLAAVEAAVRVRDALGGEVIALTMGRPQAEQALSEALALGADRGVLLTDRVFALADTIGTSRTLGLAIRKLGDVDLVLAGRKTVDAETWQVPPELAAYLGWPQLTSVVALDVVDGALHATRESDEAVEAWEVPAPAVLSIATVREPNPPSNSLLQGEIEQWDAGSLVDDLRERDKRFGQTGSPTRVLAVRDVAPTRWARGAADPAEAAAIVRERLAEWEPGATSWEKPERLGERPGASYDCWTVVELVEGRPLRVSLELLAKSRELAGKLGGRAVALVLGHDLAGVTREAARHGAEVVYELDDASLAQYHPELWAHALTSVLRRYRPHVLLVPATANGRDYGPRAAGNLELGMTGDCVGLGIDRAGRLIQSKPAYGGNIVSVIMGATTPQLATVRPRMFEPLPPREQAVEVHKVPFETLPGTRLRLLSRQAAPAWDLDEADVVVCAGEGIDPSELERLTAGRAAVGRENGRSNRRIGLYGRPVAPRVYVAVGCTGGFEHTTGFVKAGAVVALGGDEQLHASADAVLDAEWREALPALLEAL